ncbi:hypothetical protein ABTM36_20190, partial [Acinetobacter baumannii]
MFAEKLKTRCAVLLRQNENEERKAERMPCRLQIEIAARPSPIKAEVFELPAEGILITGAGVATIPSHDILKATLEDIGAC